MIGGGFPVCKVAESPVDLELAYAIRKKVFVDEQSVPQEIEYDGYDKEALHVICFLEGNLVGTGRLAIINNEVRLGRLAVLKPYRNKGIGSFILLRLINEAEFYHRGRTISANVQLDAQSFYKKFGFKEQGQTFMEADIMHIRMVKE